MQPTRIINFKTFHRISRSAFLIQTKQEESSIAEIIIHSQEKKKKETNPHHIPRIKQKDYIFLLPLR